MRQAERALDKFAGARGDESPTVARPWRRQWPDRTAPFAFPAPIRKAVDPTDAIESANREFARNRKQDPNAESASMRVDLAIREASEKWTMPIVGWKAALNHFAIVFEGRIPANAMN